MGFLPEHVSPILLTLAALGLAAFADCRRWWLVAVPTLLGLATGFLVDATGASVHDIPLVPFLVEVATIASVGVLLLRSRIESTR